MEAGFVRLCAYMFVFNVEDGLDGGRGCRGVAHVHVHVVDVDVALRTGRGLTEPGKLFEWRNGKTAM